MRPIRSKVLGLAAVGVVLGLGGCDPNRPEDHGGLPQYTGDVSPEDTFHHALGTGGSGVGQVPAGTSAGAPSGGSQFRPRGSGSGPPNPLSMGKTPPEALKKPSQ
jgi:hypothetical protein